MLSVSLAGTRQRLFNQEDPLSIWMAIEPGYDQVFIQKVFHYFDTKPCNLRFNPRSAAYCFIDFATPGECIHAMLRVLGQFIPNTNPPKKFQVSFARNPHSPEVDFCIVVSNMGRGICEEDVFKVFLSRYPSCRGVNMLRNRGDAQNTFSVRMADYYEQQQAAEEMENVLLHGFPINCFANEPRVKLPRTMEGNQDGEQFMEHVTKQVSELEIARHQMLCEQKYIARMAKLEKVERDRRLKINLIGAPVPPPELREQHEAVLLNPIPTADEWNNLEIACSNRLYDDIRNSRFMKPGLFIDCNTFQSELAEHYDEPIESIDEDYR